MRAKKDKVLTFFQKRADEDEMILVIRSSRGSAEFHSRRK